MVVGAVLFAVVAVACVYILWSRRRFYMCALKMKGPWGYPLIGIAYILYKLEDILYVTTKYMHEYKQKTLFFWFGPFPSIYTIDPSFAEKVLQSPDCLNKSMAYDAIDDAIGNGLLTSKTPKWNKHRKLLNPCFGYKVLLGLMPTFNNFARDFCEQLDKHIGCGEVDIYQIALKIGLRSSIVTSMGAESHEVSNSLIVDSCKGIFGLVMNRIVRPWLKSMSVYKWSSDYKHFTETRKNITSFIEGLIKNKLMILENKSHSDKDSEGNERTSHVFIDQAIRILQQNEFTIDEVVDETSIMVIAAFETTANTLFSTLLFLAMHPQFQERVFDEISSLFHDKEFDVANDDLNKLVYLEMCINETLRLTPSIPIIGRVCDKDLRISEDVTIPAGTEVYIDIFNIHRDEDIWGPTAKEFNPEHFLPCNMQGKHKYAFMPFSKGKRNCVGWQYAGIFLKVMLAQVIRKYKFSTTFRYEDIQFKEYITIKYVSTPLLEVQMR